MLSSVLVAYYLHQFQVPVSAPHRVDRSYEHVRTVEQRGGLTVEASSMQAASVPAGASRVQMLRLRISADCSDDVPLQTITLQRKGLGFNSDIESIYIMHRGSRISQARPITRRNGLVDINIRRFTVTACEVEDMVVYADFSQDASIASQHRLELVSIDAGKATVRIDRKLGDFTRSQVAAGSSIGQIDVDYLSINERVHYGTRQRIARFTLSSDNKDYHELHAITFTNNGSATDKDVQNLFVEFRNRRISTIAKAMADDKVRLEFSPPFELPKNSTLKFSLRGDIRASRSRTLQFIVEAPSDIEAMPMRGRR